MKLEPFDWNIVIVGRWNTAILTPGRIAEKIFEIKPPTGIFVNVPLDGISPYMVKDPQQEIVIVTEYNRLIIQIVKMDYETVQKGLKAGLKVLEWLPETPLTAAGFNIRYKTSEPIQELIDIFPSQIDSKLGSIGYTQISARAIIRSIGFGDGVLNLTIAKDDEDFTLLFNFHRQSNSNDGLKEWMRTPVNKISDTVQSITKVLGIKVEDENNDRS